MESIASAFEKMIDNTLEVRGICPNCGKELYSWKNKNKDGSDRCAPVCMECGYIALNLRADMETARQLQESIKAKAIGIFKNGSIVPNKDLFSKNMTNFKAENEEQKQIKELALKFVEDVSNGEKYHLILSGYAGRGKSHLSMAICWELLEKTGYNKKVLFINYRELMEQLKFSMVDEMLKRKMQSSVLKDLKSCNLVVLDDLGAETNGKATGFSIDMLYSIVEARQELPLIVNTNLNAKELRELYGDRISSRILNNSNGFTFRFKETTDNRLKGIVQK